MLKRYKLYWMGCNGDLNAPMLLAPLCNADNNNSSSWDVGVVALVCSESCPELVFCKLRKTGMRNTYYTFVQIL